MMGLGEGKGEEENGEREREGNGSNEYGKGEGNKKLGGETGLDGTVRAGSVRIGDGMGRGRDGMIE